VKDEATFNTARAAATKKNSGKAIRFTIKTLSFANVRANVVENNRLIKMLDNNSYIAHIGYIIHPKLIITTKNLKQPTDALTVLYPCL
jgi:hypothetical protein